MFVGKRFIVGAIFAAMATAPSAAVHADTLVLRNGQQVAGEVELVEGGYRVKTATGSVLVTRSDVAEWKRLSAPPAATYAAPVPATKPAISAGAPATSGTLLTAADKTRRTVEVLLVHGNDALALGDVKAARDCFIDVIQIDPRNRDALASLGYCYVKLDDIPRAVRSFEAALAGTPTADRGLTLNLAYALLRSRNPMRAAKIIKDYLAAHASALDEEALNAFAICLGQSNEEARQNRFWTECVAFFDQYNGKIEATRPGYKRWGVEWVPQSEWSVTEGKNKTVQARVDAKWRELQASRTQYNTLKKQYEAAHSASRFRRTSGPTPASIEPQLLAVKNRTEVLQTAYNELIAQLIKPKLPLTFSPVPMADLPTTAIASAAGTGTGQSAGISSPGTGSTGVGSAGLRATTPPTLVRPNADPQPQTNTPPVAVSPPTPPPEPVPTPQPERKRAIFTNACGFGVGPDLIVTSAASVEGATRVSVQPADSNPIDAEIVKVDAASGLALLRLKNRRIAYLPIGDGFAGGAIQCVTFPTPSMFEPTAEIIAGSSILPKDDWAIRLAKHPRLAGAPILAGGKVVGVALANRDNDMTTIPTATLASLKQFLGDVPPAPAQSNPIAAVVLVSGVREK